MNRRKLMLIFICLIFGIFVSYSQSSEIYFYRFNSLLQSELPVYLMSDGKQLAVVQPSSASQISRATLDFNDFNLSWNNIPLKKNRFTPEGVKTATSVNPATKDYLTYVDFEEKVKKHESVTGKRIVLENIYFTSGSDNILPSSNSQLNKLTNLLKNSAYLKVEVSGHTDNIGDDMSNMLLSQKRADAIKYYLIEKSISPSRIASIGKGKDEPIRENETVAGRKENRRVEILVVE